MKKNHWIMDQVIYAVVIMVSFAISPLIGIPVLGIILVAMYDNLSQAYTNYYLRKWIDMKLAQPVECKPIQREMTPEELVKRYGPKN